MAVDSSVDLEQNISRSIDLAITKYHKTFHLEMDKSQI